MELQSRIYCTRSSDIYLRRFLAYVYSHPRNSDISKVVVPAAERAEKESTYLDILRKKKRRDGTESVVACLQILLDKGSCIIKCRFLDFYPLHITLFKHTYSHKKHPKMSTKTVYVYLQACFPFDIECDNNTTLKRTKSNCDPQNVLRIHL